MAQEEKNKILIDAVFKSIKQVWSERNKFMNFNEQSIHPRLVYHIQTILEAQSKNMFFVDSEVEVSHIIRSIERDDMCSTLFSHYGSRVDIIIHSGTRDVSLVLELKTDRIDGTDCRELCCLSCHGKEVDLVGCFVSFDEDKSRCRCHIFKDGILTETYLMSEGSNWKSYKPHHKEIVSRTNKICEAFSLYENPCLT